MSNPSPLRALPRNGKREIDVDSLSIKELKELVSTAGLSFSDCIDKSDLRARANEAAAAMAQHPLFPEPLSQVAAEEDSLTEQISNLSLKDLRGLVVEAGLTPDGCTEKFELRKRAREALERLMLPSAKCGPIGEPLIVEAARRAATAAAAKKADAKEKLAQQQRAEKAEDEAMTADMVAEMEASNKTREKEKRREKKMRKKKNKADGRGAGGAKRGGEEEEEAEVEQEEEEAVEEDDSMLLRLAALRRRTTQVNMLDATEGVSSEAVETDAVVDEAHVG